MVHTVLTKLQTFAVMINCCEYLNKGLITSKYIFLNEITFLILARLNKFF